MSLDFMRFLVEDFLDKYEKLPWSSIDAQLGTLFREYHAQLKDINVASLQGADHDLLYSLNCAVDDCLVSSNKSLLSMAKQSFKICRQGKGHDTQKLEENLKKLISIISSQCGSSISAPHKPASIPLLNYKVHGFEDQFNEILKRISSKRRAVGIVGVGGSGKTTLASMVFNSREVREKYQIMIWASLTSTLNKKESTRGSVFREILSGVQNNDSLKVMLQKVKSHLGQSKKAADHVLDKYIEHFKEALERNSGKYLIVLDDVWETEYWFAEKEVSEKGKPKCILSLEWIQKTGGTIVVTSRLEEMAENIVGKMDLYMISRVLDDPCFDIFMDRAIKYGYYKLEDKQRRKLRKEDIVAKCCGLPLAACTMADIIVGKPNEVEARKEKEAPERKAEEATGKRKEAEREAEAAKGKDEAEGEASDAKDKAESEGEASDAKDKMESEGETDGSEPKAEAKVRADALKTRAAFATEIKAESAPAETTAESATIEAEEVAEAKEAIPELKAEEHAGMEMEADVSKAKEELELPPGQS